MRILLSSHGASLFGAERVMLAAAAGLAGRGHRVTIELPHGGPAVGLARAAGVDVVVSGRTHLPRNAVELARYAATFADGVRKLRALLRTESWDVVWINSIYNAPASIAARREKVATVWHLHERNFNGAAGHIAAWWIRRHADVIVVPSAFVADSFAAAGMNAASVRVVPNALLRASQPQPLRTRDRDLVAGYVGQLEPRKRATDLVDAIARVDYVRALLVGDGKARRAVEAAVRRRRIGERVRFAGFHEDVMPLLAECDCVVIPSRNEPFGLVALEAMAAGRPVIAARSGALPEVLGPAALYFPLGDVDALAGCLARMRDDPGCATRLREAGFERVKSHTIDAMLDGIESAAHEAADRRHAPTTRAHA